MDPETRMITNERSRACCPVCGNDVTYPLLGPGEDVTTYCVPAHSEGLIGSGRRCYASGLFGSEALELGREVGRDPKLPLRAHP